MPRRVPQLCPACVGAKTSTAHLTWIPDVIDSLATSPRGVSELRAYLAEPGPETAQALAWTLSGLSGKQPRTPGRGRNPAPLQSAVALLRRELDASGASAGGQGRPAMDLVYLLVNLAELRLDSGRPEAALRAVDEGIARLTGITRQRPSSDDDMDLLGDLLGLRATARQSIVIGRPNESAAPVAEAP